MGAARDWLYVTGWLPELLVRLEADRQRLPRMPADLACLSRQVEAGSPQGSWILDLPSDTWPHWAPCLPLNTLKLGMGNWGFSYSCHTKNQMLPCLLMGMQKVPCVFWAHDVVSGFQVLHGCVCPNPPCVGPELPSDFRVSWEAMLQGRGVDLRGSLRCSQPRHWVHQGYCSRGGRLPVICHTSRTF